MHLYLVKVIKQLIFWLGAILLMSLIYRSLLGSFRAAVILSSLLLPGAILLSRGIRVWRNSDRSIKWLHLIYSLLFSLYLEWMALVVAYWLIFEWQFDKLPKVLVNPFFLWLFMFFFALLEDRIFGVKKGNTPNVSGPIWHEIVSDRKRQKIDLTQINYIESKNERTLLHLDNDVITTRIRISQWEQELPDSFVRIHQSFIVNKDRLHSVRNDSVLVRGETLPISRSYKGALGH